MNIPLTRGAVAIVDDEDYEQVSKHKWNFDGQYAASKIHGKRVRMQHFLVGQQPGMFTDHINRNKLDNRRSNLRFVTKGQNIQNGDVRKDSKSGYRGVSAVNGKWAAYISSEGIRNHLGYFETPELAAQRYDQAARGLFGSNAFQNFPESETTQENKQQQTTESKT